MDLSGRLVAVYALDRSCSADSSRVAQTVILPGNQGGGGGGCAALNMFYSCIKLHFIKT